MSGSYAGAHAAAEAKKKLQQEEEEMTRYTGEELTDDFEFKILRSQTGAFKKRETVEQVMAEEAAAGWRFVEKFDDNRLRFKRPSSARRNDFSLPPGIDPYRTTYGMGEGTMAVLIISVVLGFIGVLMFILFMTGNL